MSFKDPVDLLIGGSPCQDLSIANVHREGLKGKRSILFYEYVRILRETKPKFFVFENVFSLHERDKKIITKELEVEPTLIDASLLSAQRRKRYFWIGKLEEETYKTIEIPQPEDQHIYLKDIISEECYVYNKKKGIGKKLAKSKCLLSSDYRGLNRNNNQVCVKEKEEIRRLTPEEWEMLQSLPKGYTKILSNTQRYKTLGNAFNCAVIRYILNEITKIL